MSRDLALARNAADRPPALLARRSRPSGASLPLRLCGALHALRIAGDPALAEVYPPNAPSDAELAGAVADVFATRSAEISRFIDSAPQTNEVRRSAALIAAAHWVASRHPLPMRVSELGASMGLNLNFDRYALDIAGFRLGPADAPLTLRPDWRGPTPPAEGLGVREKRGVDLNPLDPVADRDRLRAYIWADQPHRMALTEAAIAAGPPPVDRGDAVDWLAPRLGHRPGETHFVYSTVAWQYFPEERQATGSALIEEAGRAATVDTPLAWFRMEADGGEGAALTLRLWPGDLTLMLGRADFHGRWLRWEAPAPTA